MADYRARHHVILESAPTVIYPAGSIFTGAELNGETSMDHISVMTVDASDNRTGTPIRFEPGEVIAGLSEV